MTVRINFLPRNYQPPKQMGVKDFGIAAAVALAVVATGAYYATVYAGAADSERQVAADQAKHEGVKALLAEAEEIKARELRVTQAEQQLRVLAGRQWSGVLNVLSLLTPKHVAWTSMTASGDTISLRGTGRNLEDVAQLLGGLVTETTVKQVSLKTVTEKGIPVAVTVKSGDTNAPKDVGKDSTSDSSKDGGKDKKDPTQAAVDSFLEALRGSNMPREMEFDLTITLVPAEGRNVQHGA